MIFALDCSQSGFCLAILEGGRLIASLHEDPCAPQSTLLLKKIDELFMAAKLDLSAIDTVLFCHGPGSFTSLRVGHATLTGLFTAGREMRFLACSSLLARSLAVPRRHETVVILMRAGRERIYRGILSSEGGFTESVVGPKVILEDLLALAKPTIVTGDGLSLFSDDDRLCLTKSKNVVFVAGDPLRPESFLKLYDHPLTTSHSTLSELKLNYLQAPDIG